MVFNTRSGNFYRYDRYTHQIEPIAARALSKSGEDDMCMDKLSPLSFEPVPNITTLPNISTFIIEVTRQCNLRCTYCCYSGKYPHNRIHENKSISESQLPVIFDFIEENRVKDRQLTISFYGGEPLLNKALLQTAVKEIKERFPSDTEIVVSTNLLNFDIDIDLEWCINNNITLNVSIDGPQEIHDKQRTHADGKGSYNEVIHILSAIKQKSIYFFINNVNLLVTVTDISYLLPIAKFWENNDTLCSKEPFSISGVSNVFDNTSGITDEDGMTNTLYELLDYYECHRNNLFIKSYLDILTSPIMDRPIYDLIEPASSLCCLPYNPRCFIDATGSVGICEKTCDELRIGTIQEGFDYGEINTITQQMASVKQKKCSQCWMQRFCQLCFTNYALTDKELSLDCEYQKMWTLMSLIITCEMAERNLFDSPDAKQCRLRPLFMGDASAVFRIMSDFKTTKYIDGLKPMESIQDAVNFIGMFERNSQNVSSFLKAIEYDDIGMIGMLGYDEIDEATGKANLFFVLDREYWHRGIMTTMMAEFIYQSNVSLKNIDIVINQDNRMAKRLMNRFKGIEITWI